MAGQFLQRLCNLITTSEPFDPETLSYVRRAFEDTLAVACAGWAEPVTRKVASNYRGGEEMTPDDPSGVDSEAAAMIYGTAAHALDFDDVHQVSNTHPSAPIVAGLVTAVKEEPRLAPRTITAFGIGLACNVELGRVMGFAHYEKGWHATSTIGPLACAAALSFLYGLDAKGASHALALAAAQCGGLQRNFGTMAKPLHAGLAGAAGLRAARLARAGLTGDDDIFGERGYFDLYSGDKLSTDPDKVEFDLYGGGIAVKLYPCCYNNHRNIALAFEARKALEEKGLTVEDVGKVEVEGPYGAFMALRIKEPPRVGSEAKFCGAYVAACALIDGEVGLAHFEDDNVSRADVRALSDRISLTERPKGQDKVTRDKAPVKLTVYNRDGEAVVQIERVAAPGAPDDAPTPEQMEAKVRDCLDYYSRNTGRNFDYGRFQAFVDGLFRDPSADEQPSLALGDD
ncbi:MAG: MmgE/PrpD family protein [SAR324 cluster bacterium]|nr:MmgE/PrpD family protein [SAR324 cluster bacterium]MCZ6646727.1 MmgE/PrpD family protein [SAR324 cluster bacterium]